MIETMLIEKQTFIPLVQLLRLEKIVRLHFELENLQGFEIIHNLLERIETMQEEIIRLTNRLKAYEG
jgi:hypothetical protein